MRWPQNSLIFPLQHCPQSMHPHLEWTIPSPLLINLVLGFEPPMVYSMTETIPARVTQAWDEAEKGQPMTPCQLGIQNPKDPTFSDVLHRREVGPLLVGCPNPPHIPDLLRGGPPDPLGSSSWPECKPQPSPKLPQ